MMSPALSTSPVVAPLLPTPLRGASEVDGWSEAPSPPPAALASSDQACGPATVPGAASHTCAVQVGRGGIADLIAVQRIVDVEGRGLALLHVLEVGAEVHHELVRAVGRDGDVGDVDAFAGRCHQISDGTGGGDVVGRAVVRIER